MTKFREWFKENLAEYAHDIANHGADAGWPHITYTNECVELYDRFEDDIYNMLRDDADGMGYPNIDAMVATFNRADMLDYPETRKNLLLWYACERVAQEYEDEQENAA